jgi:hypothetical protein
MSINEYAHVQAMTVHTALAMNIQYSYPELSVPERDELFIDVIDVIARMRGWVVKREYFESDE